MSELIESKTQLPANFDPENSQDKQAQADAIIKYAKDVKDWPLLERAVDTKIEEQAQFVAWWESNVIRPGGNMTATVIFAQDAERLTGFSIKRVSRIRQKLKDIEKYRKQLYGAAWKKAFGDVVDDNARAIGKGIDEWYTPIQYIHAAREVMGDIDLDPATSEAAQSHIQAKNYFTAKDNALIKEWHGRVWLNPPYSKELIGPFIQKLADEFGSGRVQEAIVLTHNYTDTGWFHTAEAGAALICFTRGRIAFESPDGDKAVPTQGQAFFYYGDNAEKFSEVFREYGFVR